MFILGMASKVAVLYFEARWKKASLTPQYRLYAPESLVNFFNRTVLWWLNPLFWQGYADLLSMEKLYDVDPDLASGAVEASFQAARTGRCDLIVKWLY